jgi:CheY-like chemotaxis protein
MGRTTLVKKRVLVVEDLPDHRKTLRWLLEKWGYVVAEAADGLAGVEEALAWHPRVALVDIGLPSLDGYQVARQVREALHGEVVLIAVTGYDEPRAAFDAGFDLHMVKPIDPHELRQTLDEITSDELL